MKKAIVLICVLITALTFCFASCDNQNPPVIEENEPLFSFDENGEFTVLHITDFHECLNERDVLLEDNVNVILNAIADCNPDLIVFGGDNVFPLSMASEVIKHDTLLTISAFAEVMNEQKIYWTMVFGNHDDECLYTKVQQTEHAKSVSSYFLGSVDDEDDYYVFYDEQNNMVGNYIYPIYSHDKKSVKYNVMCLDSGSVFGSANMHVSYNTIQDSQVEWYSKTCDAISKANDNAIIPIVSFFHIPLEEHELYYNYRNNENDVIRWVGNFGGYSLSEYDNELFETAVERGDMTGIFTGHNHYNSITMLCKTDNQNVVLSTTRQAGVYNDGSGTHYNGFSRVINLKENGLFSTYLIDYYNNCRIEEFEYQK